MHGLIIGEADVTAEVERLQDAARERLRTEAHQGWLGPAADLQAHRNGIVRPEATDAMRQVAIETVWRAARRARLAYVLLIARTSRETSLFPEQLRQSLSPETLYSPYNTTTTSLSGKAHLQTSEW